MKYIIGLFAIVIVVMTGLPAGAVNITGTFGSSAANCGSYNAPNNPRATFMVGDSISVSGKSALQDLRPSWEINALGGRTVDCLPGYVAERKTEGPIGKLIIALGTNAVEGWGQEQYQHVVDMVPNSTEVIFVTTYRDRTIWNVENGYKYRALAGTQYYYTKYMTNIAGSNPNVCLAPWRTYALNHTDVVHDGVHPTAEGRGIWAGIVARATSNCIGNNKR